MSSEALYDRSPAETWPSFLSAGQQIEVLERVPTARGELVLRARHVTGPGKPPRTVYEIISNGVFLMDSEESSTERALAVEGLAPLEGRPGLRVLVGGLGLGYTLAATLEAQNVAEVVVVELEPTLVTWVAGPLRHLTGDPLADRRVEVRVHDVVDYLEQEQAPFHAILLDVDNGPGFIVHAENGWLYSPAGLERMRDTLTAGGVLTIWSSERSLELRNRLETVFGGAREVALPARRGDHHFSYYLYQGIRLEAPR